MNYNKEDISDIVKLYIDDERHLQILRKVSLDVLREISN